MVFDDADLTAAIHGAVAGALINTGQDCTAATRAIAPIALRRVRRRGRRPSIAASAGPTADPATDLGPLISMVTARRHGMVDRAHAYARVVTGGGEFPVAFRRGLVFRAHADRRRRPSSEVVRDEIFGPVLCAWAFDSDDEKTINTTTRRTGRAPRSGPGMSTGPCDRPARSEPGASGQRPHPDHQRDAARQDEGVRLRR